MDRQAFNRQAFHRGPDLRSGYTRFGHGNGTFRSRSVEGVNSPVALPAWVIRYIEVWQLTLLHAVELLAIHGPVRDPCPSDLSERQDLNSGVFGGADSAAPSSGRARHRYPARNNITLFICSVCSFDNDMILFQSLQISIL